MAGYIGSKAVLLSTTAATVTGDMTVDTSTLKVDSSNNRVGIGTASPDMEFHVKGAGTVANFEGTGGSTFIQLKDSDDGTVAFLGADGGSVKVQTSGSSYSDKLIIDTNGHVTMPKQSAFNATNDGTQSNIALATQVTIALGTERFDQNADFASNTFTAPVTGKYQLNIFIRIDNLDSAAHYYELRILTSNSGYGIIMDPDFGQDQSYFNMAFAVLADMDASDTAKVELRQEGGTAQTDILDARFSGFLVC